MKKLEKYIKKLDTAFVMDDMAYFSDGYTLDLCTRRLYNSAGVRVA